MSDPVMFPPAAPGTPPIPEPGSVVLYNGAFNPADWKGIAPLTLDIANYTPGQVYSIAGTSANNTSDVIAFNLPEGCVLTLLENPIPTATNPFNFAKAGKCVDLFGNGKTQTVDLGRIGAENCISAFIWRQVDYAAGCFQLFDGVDFTGNRNTFFLSEWNGNAINGLGDWWICDRAGSAYFAGLTVQTITLYDGGDGKGLSCSFAAWFKKLNISHLGTYGDFDNKAGSWSWVPLKPLQATIPSTTFDTVVPSEALQATEFPLYVENDTNSTITAVTDVTYANSTSITVSLTQSAQNSIFESFTASYTVGDTLLEGQSASVSATVGVTQTFTDTNESDTTKTQEFSFSADVTVSVPPFSVYKGTATVTFINLPPLSQTVTGYYYYDKQVAGSVPATLKPYGQVFLLEQPVMLTIAGGLSVPVVVKGEPEALPMAALLEARMAIS